MQQIQQRKKVLRGSESNYILSDLHLTGVNEKKLLTSTFKMVIYVKGC